MKLIHPLCIHTKSACFCWVDVFGIVEVQFGNEYFSSTSLFFEFFHFLLQFLHEVHGAIVEHSVHSIESQPIHSAFIKPEQCVLQEESSYTKAPFIVEVYNWSPG